MEIYTRIIDRKYEIVGYGSENFGIFKIGRHTQDNAIPTDEPLILFRARDRLAVPMLRYYEQLCSEAIKDNDVLDLGQLELLHRRIADFLEWQRKNTNKLKVPSSEELDNFA